MSRIKETKVYNINDFINWHQLNELELSPKYQRNPVWNLKAKSYLVDSILKGLPIPQLFIRQMIDTRTKKTMREVIDGQQRLRAIIEFVNNEFEIQKSHNIELAGLRYDDLDEDLKEDFLGYEFPVEVIKVKDDSIIYDMFARLNTNSMTLNSQELRNAKYWGEFKVFVYRLAAKWRYLFIDINMFNDKQLSRMLDIEYMSSLIILIIDGIIAENQSKLDDYYKRFDEDFPILEDVEHKLDCTLETIKRIFEDNMFETDYFQRKNYFYTLFAVIAHMLFGIENLESERLNEYSTANIDINLSSLISRLMEFESYFDRFMNDTLYESNLLPNMIKFEQFHRTRTTSQLERKVRISILCEFIVSN